MFYAQYKATTNLCNIERFFATAFLRTAAMVSLAIFTGVLGRIFTINRLSPYSARGFVFLLLVISLIIDVVIKRHLYKGNESMISKLCYGNVGVLGLLAGIITSVYGLQMISKALFASCIIFVISAAYGYITKKDMSQIWPVISCLGISCLMLGLVGLVGSFFNREFAQYIFSIESCLSIFFNLLFIVAFVNSTRKIYFSTRYNKQALQILNIYASYTMFHNIFSMFLDIMYLLGRRERNNK